MSENEKAVVSIALGEVASVSVDNDSSPNNRVWRYSIKFAPTDESLLSSIIFSMIIHRIDR